MTPEEQARRLAEWLDGHPGTDPPLDLDPEVVEAVYALRPDLAPAPRVSADDILAELATGPLAEGAPAPIEGGSDAAVVPFPEPDRAPAPAPRRRPTWGWGTATGTLVALAAALVLVVRYTGQGPRGEPAPTSAPVAQTSTAAPRTPEVAEGAGERRDEDLERGLRAGKTTETEGPMSSEPAVAEAPDTGMPPRPRPRLRPAPRPVTAAPSSAAGPARAQRKELDDERYEQPPPAVRPSVAASADQAGSAPATGLDKAPAPRDEGSVVAQAELDAVRPNRAHSMTRAPTGASAPPAEAAGEPAPPPAVTETAPSPAVADAEPVADLPTGDDEAEVDNVQSAEAPSAPAASGFARKDIDMQDQVVGGATAAPAEDTVATARRGHKPLFGARAKSQAPEATSIPAHASTEDDGSHAETITPDLGALRARAVPPDLSHDALLARTPTPQANALAGDGDYEQAAQQALTNAARPAPIGPTAAAQAAAWYLAAGQPSDSMDATAQGLRNALGNTPEITWLWVLRGDAQRAAGDPGAAAKSYEQAIELNTARAAPKNMGASPPP